VFKIRKKIEQRNDEVQQKNLRSCFLRGQTTREGLLTHPRGLKGSAHQMKMITLKGSRERIHILHSLHYHGPTLWKTRSVWPVKCFPFRSNFHSYKSSFPSPSKPSPLSISHLSLLPLRCLISPHLSIPFIWHNITTTSLCLG